MRQLINQVVEGVTGSSFGGPCFFIRLILLHQLAVSMPSINGICGPEQCKSVSLLNNHKIGIMLVIDKYAFPSATDI